MSTTWASCLSSGDKSRLRFYVTVQGVPYAFQQSDVDLPSALLASTYTRFKGMSIPQQGGSDLDLSRRRMIGGSLRFTLQEDGSGTLAALFAPRKRRTTYVTSDHTASAATINVDDTTSLDAAGTVWISGETIAYTGTTATTLTGCTRGAFGSKAQALFGASTGGHDVLTSPPSWVGRRVTLFGYFEDENGNTSADLQTELGTFNIEDNPSFDGASLWTIQASELSDIYARKTVGRGIDSFELAAPTQIVADVTAGQLRLNLTNSGQTEQRAVDAFSVGGLITSLALIRCEDGHRLHPVIDVSSGFLRFYDTNLVPATESTMALSVRNVQLLEADPVSAILFMLMSVVGDGTNDATYDALAGRIRDDFGEYEWQFGAAIDAADVDTSSFEVFADLGVTWAYPLFHEHELTQALFDFCFITDSFWYVNRSGQIAVRKIEDGSSSSFTIDSSVIAPATRPSIEFDESSIHPRVIVNCNYHPIHDRYDRVLVVNDVEMRERYKERIEDHVISLRALHVITNLGGPTVAPPQSAGAPDPNNPNGGSGSYSTIYEPDAIEGLPLRDQGEIFDLLRADQARDGRGQAIVNVTCTIAAFDVDLGDVVSLTVSLPDLEGASTISARRALVVGREPNLRDATVTLRLLLLEAKVHRVAPACVIDSVSVNTLTLEANSTTYPESVDNRPGDMFPAGATIRIWDVSAGTSVERVVSSTGGTTVILSSAPPAIEDGVDFITLSSQAAAGNDSSNGFDVSDFCYQMPDNENDASVVEITRLS